MLPFFRKIRYRLAQDNQFFKYSRYAIGEIVLVVIGILIALYINNWNEERKERNEEKEILEDLKKDLEMNITLISNDWSQRSFESCSIILEVLKNKQPYHDSLAYHFHSSRIFADLTLSTSSYQALKNKGFDLVSSKPLRKKIINHFEVTINTIRERIFRIEGNTRPYFQTFVYENFESDIDSSTRLIPNDYGSLLNNQIYFNIISQRRNFQRMNMEVRSEYKIESQNLLDEINSELTQ